MSRGIKSAIRSMAQKRGYDVIHYGLLRPEIYRRIYGEQDTAQKNFYNIGAGLFRHPAWTNVDHPSAWYSENEIDISWDLTQNVPVPIENERANLVYTSHVIEHITNANAQNLFAEAHRILKPGGGFRITTPNIDLDLMAYQKGDTDFFYWCYIEPAWQIAAKKQFQGASIAQMFLHHFASQLSCFYQNPRARTINDSEVGRIFSSRAPAEAFDYFIEMCSLEVHRENPNHHINWWNYNKLSAMLKSAGFTDVYLSAYGQSRYAVLRDTSFFDTTHPRLPLHVEALK